MGITKDYLFGEEHISLSRQAKALGHPARLAILRRIMIEKEASNWDFQEDFPLSQPTITQHLNELMKANLISRRVKGARYLYAINGTQWRITAFLFDDFFRPKLGLRD